MNWNTFAQLLATLLVSVVATMVVLRYEKRIAMLSGTRTMVLSLGLLALAALIALGPALLRGLLPSPEMRSVLLRRLFELAILGALNAAAYAAVTGTLLLLSSSDTRARTLRNHLGPGLGVLGFGAALAFSGGRMLAGLEDISIRLILSDLSFPVVLLVMAALLSRQWSREDISSLRLLSSLAAGGGAFNYSLGFISGFFVGFLDAIRDVLSGALNG